MGVEYSSQANPANPHFFGSAPLPCWFLGGSGVLFNFAIVYYYVMMMVKEIYTEIYYIAQRRLFEINWKNSCVVEAWKPALDGAGRLHPPLTINEKTPFCYLIFRFPPSRPLVEMRIILIWYFFTFCLLEISSGKRGVLFANHLHLLFIIFWMMLLIQKYYYLQIIFICTALTFANRYYLKIICIWKLFLFV